MTENPFTKLTGLAAHCQERLDHDLSAWQENYLAQGGRIHCARGCANCCNLAVETTLPEAMRIASLLKVGQIEDLQSYIDRLLPALSQITDLKSYLRLHRQKIGPCPFLTEEGACGIYADRPLACRALLSTRNSDWCAVDFADLHPLEKEAFMSSLDREVVAFPTHYAAVPQQLATELEGELNHAMQESFGCRVSGNLPLLVWLELNHNLSTQLTESIQATRERLSSLRLDLPFIIRLADSENATLATPQPHGDSR